jgi:hypothetical protein
LDRAEVAELHFITHLDNLASILQRGILCHEEAAKIEHVSVAMQEVQDIRAGVRVPGGQLLHHYTNLYFNARNTMMYVRHGSHESLGVISVRHEALDLPDVVVTDCNAASTGFAEFGTRDEMLPKLSHDEIFAESWNHADYYEKRRHKARMCAEVLVPRALDPSFIRGVYVSCDATLAAMAATHSDAKFKVEAYMFFQGPRP